MKRKCSYRILLICKNGDARIITQDIRRKKNIITGMLVVSNVSKYGLNTYNAKSLGCSLIVREK